MVLVLIRHFNDIDHITPIIYRILKDNYSDLRLFCMNIDQDLRNDFRLEFLESYFGCKARYIFQSHTPSILHRLFSLLVCRLRYLKVPQGFNWVARVCNKLSHIVYESRWQGKLYNKAWAKQFLEQFEVTTLVVDWGNGRRFNYKAISDAATELGIPKIGVPHGMTLMINDDASTNRSGNRLSSFWWEEYGWLDQVVVATQSMKEQIARGGYPADRLRVMGSARFCREWTDIYRRILPPQDVPVADGCLRILYMDHDKSYRLNTNEIVETFRDLAASEWATVIIKKSTRTPLSDERLSDFATIDTDTSSVHLISWADVVISTISSIMLEVINQRKIFIYPTGFTENEMLFERYGACWPVSSREQLLDILASIHQGTYELPYSDTNVEAFKTEVVYGGNPDADVLSDYANYILARHIAS